MESKKIEKWTEINRELKEKLTRLEELDKERKKLISKEKKMNELTPEMKEAMEVSLAKYIQLAEEVSALKKASETK